MFWYKNFLKFLLATIVVFVFVFLLKTKTAEDIARPPETPKNNPVTLGFAGDIMLDRGVRTKVEKYFDSDYRKIFENIDLNKFDIFFANLEGTASDIGRNVGSIYSFHMDPMVIPALKNTGIDILSLANNHVGDWTVASYVDTLKRFKENTLLFTGGGMNSAEAENPTVIEKNGLRIGFLAFSDVGPKWMEVGVDKPGLLIANNRLGEIVKNASLQVDYLIVSFHFGEEYQTTHNARQEYLAHLAIDSGAKIIIGQHPHVVQDFESYKDGYIAYSLGNFVFDQSWSEATMQGMLLEITLDKSGIKTIKKVATKLNKYFQPSIVQEINKYVN
jgi:poly-gamma-glutamate synthesis protein (capsule biosynthesis protein)